MEKLKLLRSKPKNNRTGVVGVSATINRNQKGKPMRCFSVNYMKNGKHATKKFYYSKYGSKEKAFKAAVAFRKAYEKEVQKENKLIQQRIAAKAKKNAGKAKKVVKTAVVKKKTAPKKKASKK